MGGLGKSHFYPPPALLMAREGKKKKKEEQAGLTGIIQPPWLVRGGINEAQGSWIHMIQTCVIEDGCSLRKD